MNRAASLLLLMSLLALAVFAPAVSAQGNGRVGIVHTPPASPVPGQQIALLAVLENATSAVVLWNNGSLPKASALPMTNLSQAQAGGWAYEAWLPAQPDGAQVTYSITATGPAGTDTMNYTLSVAAPSPQGMTPANQDAWNLTMAAVLSMAASTVVAVYYFTSLRLRREPR